MKELINNKLVEIIKYIIDKPVDQITYNEYCILDSKLKSMEYKENQERNREDYNLLLGKLMTNSLDPVPTPLTPIPENN